MLYPSAQRGLDEVVYNIVQAMGLLRELQEGASTETLLRSLRWEMPLADEPAFVARAAMSELHRIAAHGQRTRESAGDHTGLQETWTRQ